jgi:hypothetical protein
VLESDGKTTTYTFGNDYAVNAGKLLSKKITGAGVNYQEVLQYVTSADSQPFADQIGVDNYQIMSNPYLLKNRPLRSKVITQDGYSYSMTVEQFDEFARPVRVKKESYLGTPP